MIPTGYTLSNLKRALKEPERIKHEIKRRRQRFNEMTWIDAAVGVNSGFYRLCNRARSYDIIDEDWDVLVILDACRPELLAPCLPEDWELETRVSPGSESWEFLRTSFGGQQLHDTIYVTANPHAPNIKHDTFNQIIYLLDSEYWDSDLKTVPPSAVTEAAAEIAAEQPNKRIIVHFMQPHFPFLGETGQEIDQQGLTANDASHPWKAQMESNEIGHERLLQAYQENHELVVPHVKELTDEIHGKTVVTADHANLIGERTYPIPIRTYGYPRGFHHPNLVEVPWVELDSGQRRDTFSEPPVVTEKIDDEVAKKRLRDLGYA